MGFNYNGVIDFTSFNEVESGPVLPADYTQLDYIASSGTQYIDTGYYWQNENVKIVMDAIVTSNGASQSLFGNEDPVSGGRHFSIVPHGSGGTYGYYVGLNAPLLSGIRTLVLNQRFIMECETTANKLFTVKVDGVLKGSATYSGSVRVYATTTSTNASKGKIYIFANHNSSTNGANAIQQIGGMKLYKFQMWDNNVLVRYFIPCKNSDNIVGLYDIVEGKFYSSPVGTFTAGSTITMSALESDQNVQIRITSDQVLKGSEFIEF